MYDESGAKGKIGYSDVNILKAILERLGNP